MAVEAPQQEPEEQQTESRMHKGSTTHRLSQPRQTIYERVRHTPPQAMQYGTHPSRKNLPE